MDFLKISNIKFHENPSSGSRVVLCRWTDMTKPIAAFCNFASAPKKQDMLGKILKDSYARTVGVLRIN
jgi:hypothetical protein